MQTHRVTESIGRRSVTCVDGRITQKHKRRTINIDRGEISIALTERRTQTLGADGTPAPVHSDMVELSARIKAFLEHGQSSTVLFAHIGQIKLFNGFSSLSPVICVGRSLPNDSKIFQIVRVGDVEEVQRLLDRGEFSLWDRNSYGTPLLHVSKQRSRQSVKYILTHSACLRKQSVPDVQIFARAWSGCG